jgi:peptide-methionine (S)-S-oxide reductase
VIRTRVGYAGGRKKSPTYRSIGDHTEAVQLDYDPATISYEELLDIFWNSHEPSAHSFSRQYLNAVFYQNTDQRDAALASKAALERKSGGTVKTVIVPINSFTMAEDYHQKYMLKSIRNLQNEMARIYPHQLDFVNSTAVTRLNGYAGGYGSEEQLSEELDTLGLSSEGKEELISLIRR